MLVTCYTVAGKIVLIVSCVIVDNYSMIIVDQIEWVHNTFMKIQSSTLLNKLQSNS